MIYEWLYFIISTSSAYITACTVQIINQPRNTLFYCNIGFIIVILFPSIA